MSEITQLILDDHDRMRRAFATLDEIAAAEKDPQRRQELLSGAWSGLAELLDLHADAEERILYPQLLEYGKDADDETDDAIGDHNDIRDGAHAAAEHDVDSDEWWKAVTTARAENSKHMAEEEREALADFRRTAPLELRHRLGRDWVAFVGSHERTHGVDSSDKDPQEYVARHS
jgi:hypothetical protein